MGIHGNLRSLGVLELFSMLNQGRKTGVLTLITENTERGFMFKEGNLICATASDEQRRLGNFLVRLGFLSIDSINEAGRLSQYSPGHFGQQLLENGEITSEQLRIAVRSQIFTILNEVLGWDNVAFFFDDTALLSTPNRGVVATPSFILEVAKRSDDHQFAKQLFPEMNLVFDQSPDLDVQAADSEYQDILGLVNGKHSIEQILCLCPNPPRQTAQSLKTLWEQDMIRRVGIKVNSLDRVIIPDIHYTAVSPETPARTFRAFNSSVKKQQALLSGIIGQEPLIAAKILKLISLSNIELTRSDLTVERLIHLLGGFQTRCLLLPTAVRNLYFPKNDLYWRECWEHDRICALLCRAIAQKINYPFPEEAYLIGLLHNLGVYIFLTNNAKDYRWLVSESYAREMDISTLEDRYFGVTHMKLGGIYAKKWNFPPLFRTAISKHHRGDASSKKPLMHILYLADSMVHDHGFMLGYQEKHPERLERSLELLGLTSEAVDALCSKVERIYLRGGFDDFNAEAAAAKLRLPQH